MTFAPPAYGGSTSDRQIVERSGLSTKCDPGAEVMPDKGFNVEDVFIPYLVSVNIPTFFKKRIACRMKRFSRRGKLLVSASTLKGNWFWQNV